MKGLHSGNTSNVERLRCGHVPLSRDTAYRRSCTEAITIVNFPNVAHSTAGITRRCSLRWQALYETSRTLYSHPEISTNVCHHRWHLDQVLDGKRFPAIPNDSPRGEGPCLPPKHTKAPNKRNYFSKKPCGFSEFGMQMAD